MKTFQILTILSIFLFLTTACTRENKTDFEVNVVNEHDNHAVNTSSLNVKVVNELDPICGMDNAIHLKDTANYQGKTYGFCNTMCKEKFLETPEEYVNE